MNSFIRTLIWKQVRHFGGQVSTASGPAFINEGVDV